MIYIRKYKVKSHIFAKIIGSYIICYEIRVKLRLNPENDCLLSCDNLIENLILF